MGISLIKAFYFSYPKRALKSPGEMRCWSLLVLKELTISGHIFFIVVIGKKKKRKNAIHCASLKRLKLKIEQALKKSKINARD